mgnify:CR=1 FL=1
MGRALPTVNTAQRPPLILIADDTDVSRALLRRMLVRTGFRTLLAEDGAHAIALAEKRRPNMLLLDLRLTDIDGSAVLSHLRDTFDAVTLPIIMVSAEHDGEVIAACLGLGANDFVTKPIHFPTLRARMETHLRVQAARAALGDLPEILPPSAHASAGFAPQRP